MMNNKIKYQNHKKIKKIIKKHKYSKQIMLIRIKMLILLLILKNKLIIHQNLYLYHLYHLIHSLINAQFTLRLILTYSWKFVKKYALYIQQKFLKKKNLMTKNQKKKKLNNNYNKLYHLEKEQISLNYAFNHLETFKTIIKSLRKKRYQVS